MKFGNHQVELACDPKDVREYITQPYLDVDKGELASTNGRILSVVKVVVDDTDKSGYVPTEAIKAARKCATGKQSERVLLIDADDELTIKNGQTFKRPELGTYPDYKKVLDGCKDNDHYRVSLDAKYLMDLAKALNTHGDTRVVLSFSADPNSSIRVEPAGSPLAKDNVGVLMPCRFD